MFDWLKRKQHKTTQAEGRWTLVTSEESGKVILYRIRQEHPGQIQFADYPKLMALQWKYVPANEYGLPTEAEREQMDLLEDLLDASLEKNRQAFLTVIVTGKGIREWQWYARDEKETLRQINETLSSLTPFPIQIMFADDPEWNAYARFEKSVLRKDRNA